MNKKINVEHLMRWALIYLAILILHPQKGLADWMVLNSNDTTWEAAPHLRQSCSVQGKINYGNFTYTLKLSQSAHGVSDNLYVAFTHNNPLLKGSISDAKFQLVRNIYPLIDHYEQHGKMYEIEASSAQSFMSLLSNARTAFISFNTSAGGMVLPFDLRTLNFGIEELPRYCNGTIIKKHKLKLQQAELSQLSDVNISKLPLVSNATREMLQALSGLVFEGELEAAYYLGRHTLLMATSDSERQQGLKLLQTSSKYGFLESKEFIDEQYGHDVPVSKNKTVYQGSKTPFFVFDFKFGEPNIDINYRVDPFTKLISVSSASYKCTFQTTLSYFGDEEGYFKMMYDKIWFTHNDPSKVTPAYLDYDGMSSGINIVRPGDRIVLSDWITPDENYVSNPTQNQIRELESLAKISCSPQSITGIAKNESWQQFITKSENNFSTERLWQHTVMNLQ